MYNFKVGDLVVSGGGRRALIIGENKANAITGLRDVVHILWFDTGKTRYIRRRWLTKLEVRGV